MNKFNFWKVFAVISLVAFLALSVLVLIRLDDIESSIRSVCYELSDIEKDLWSIRNK